MALGTLQIFLLVRHLPGWESIRNKISMRIIIFLLVMLGFLNDQVIAQFQVDDQTDVQVEIEIPYQESRIFKFPSSHVSITEGPKKIVFAIMGNKGNAPTVVEFPESARFSSVVSSGTHIWFILWKVDGVNRRKLALVSIPLIRKGEDRPEVAFYKLIGKDGVRFRAVVQARHESLLGEFEVPRRFWRDNRPVDWRGNVLINSLEELDKAEALDAWSTEDGEEVDIEIRERAGGVLRR